MAKLDPSFLFFFFTAQNRYMTRSIKIKKENLTRIYLLFCNANRCIFVGPRGTKRLYDSTGNRTEPYSVERIAHLIQPVTVGTIASSPNRQFNATFIQIPSPPPQTHLERGVPFAHGSSSRVRYIVHIDKLCMKKTGGTALLRFL